MAIEIDLLTHCYGSRVALSELSLRVEAGETFVVLGPNGGGKSTLFRLLATLMPVQKGRVEVLGRRLPGEESAVRQLLGVVFQSPSLDKKLTVRENLQYHAALYGLFGRAASNRIDGLLDSFGLRDRADERAETLSGGLRRRVDLAKGLVSSPRILLMDEPSVGLDPGARLGMWNELERVRKECGVTVLLTTHLLDEADRADRIAILDRGKLVALGSPDDLRAAVGGDIVTIHSDRPGELAKRIQDCLHLDAHVVAGCVRLEVPAAHEWVSRIAALGRDAVQSLTFGKPTLEDVFIRTTGRSFDASASGGGA